MARLQTVMPKDRFKVTASHGTGGGYFTFKEKTFMKIIVLIINTINLSMYFFIKATSFRRVT